MSKAGEMSTFGLVIDCLDPEALAYFGAPALHYEPLSAAGNYVLLVPMTPGPPKLLLQRVPETKSVKNRTHLDIEVADIEAESRRLEALGARRVNPDVQTEPESSWVLMVDSEGNEFCVCDGGAPA